MSSSLMGWTSNVQEPKRLNRYELLLDDNLRLTCKSVTIPQISVEETDIHRMHTYYKVAGSKISYSDVTCVFYDFVDNAALTSIETWHTSIFDVATSLMGFPSAYKKNITLLMYGPDHSVVESWVLVGAWPKSFARKDLSWEDKDGHQEVTLVLAVDEVTITTS